MYKYVIFSAAFLLFAGCASNPKIDFSRDDFGPYAIVDDGNEPLPVVRVEHTYPRDAARRRIEGYVIMSGVINVRGDITNIKVLESVPKGIFDKNAIAAFSKYRYRPYKDESGNLYEKEARVQLSFKLR